MSSVSGWNRESLAALKHALSSSPEGLAALALMGLVGVIAVVIVGFFVSSRVSGFVGKVYEEEEQARREELEEEARRAQETPDAPAQAQPEEEDRA